MRKIYSKKSILSYLNKNSAANKIVSLRNVVTRIHNDKLCINEIPLEDSF